MDPQIRIAMIEREIEKKYGKLAAENPRAWWNEEKEFDYIAQKKNSAEQTQIRKEQKEEREGFLVTKRLLKSAEEKEEGRKCPICGAFFFSTNDNVYMNKYGACFKCFVTYIEDREKRWKDGWRPNK